jgi:signal transduction histidine kinase
MAARRGRSLRFRITLAATLIVALAIVAGAGIFTVILRSNLESGVLSAAETDAAGLSTRIDAAGLPAIANEQEHDDRIYQVVDSRGQVVQASKRAQGTALATVLTSSHPTVTIDGEPYILVVTSARHTSREIEIEGTSGGRSRAAKHGSGDDNGGDDNGGNSGSGGGSTVVVSPGPTVTVTSPPETPAPAKTNSVTNGYIIVAGRSTKEATETMSTVVRLLAIAVPLLIVLIAGTTWLVVGRSLRPVDRMRAELDEVTATNLHRRVADPGSADEISRLALTMNGVLDRLDESQRAQRRFVSDASHELKSPLASLRQYAEVSAAHPDRISQEELADAVLDEGARLERLVQSMLVLAKADEQLLETGSSPVDLDDLLFTEARRVRASGRVSVDTTAVGAARIVGDEGMIAQVVRNLVDNAVRHATSAVSLSAMETDVAVVLNVDDDGSGVAVADRGRIFDRFVRLDEARARESGGSGLGLAIVAELVRAHGGTVTVGDAPLGGARFEVRLPTPA